MIVVGAAHVETLPAQELHARRVAGYRERERVLPVVVGQAVAGNRIDGDLIRDGAERRQHPAAPHHQAGIGLLDGSERDVLGEVIRGGRGAAALEVHQCVGEGYIVLPQKLVVVEHVLLELRPVLGEVVGGAGPCGEDRVHEVRRPPHHAATGPGPVRHHFPFSHQVVHRVRDLEGQAHRIPGGRRGEGHLLPQRRVVLHVVEGGHGLDPVSEAGMGGYVVHPLALDPHLAGPFFQPGYIFLSGARWHGPSPPLANPIDRGG